MKNKKFIFTMQYWHSKGRNPLWIRAWVSNTLFWVNFLSHKLQENCRICKWTVFKCLKLKDSMIICRLILLLIHNSHVVRWGSRINLAVLSFIIRTSFNFVKKTYSNLFLQSTHPETESANFGSLQHFLSSIHYNIYYH